MSTRVFPQHATSNVYAFGLSLQKRLIRYSHSYVLEEHFLNYIFLSKELNLMHIL